MVKDNLTMELKGSSQNNYVSTNYNILVKEIDIDKERSERTAS